MAMPDEHPLPVIQPEWLRPYFSIIVLRNTARDKKRAISQLIDFLKVPVQRSGKEPPVIVADGIAAVDDAMPYRVNGFIYRQDSRPSWANDHTGFVDTRHSLALALTYKEFVAVYCDNHLKGRLQRWLTRPPIPPFVRVPPEVFQGALLQGEARGLWLQGTHTRRATRPDTKNLSGQRLQDALNPLEDSSFAFSSARASLPPADSRQALTGSIGTTPSDALIWGRGTNYFDEFVEMVLEALRLLEETINAGAEVVRPFPILAVRSYDLSGVHNAFDLATTPPDELSSALGAYDELIDAAQLLERALLEVRGQCDSADFVVDVGLEGAHCGTLQGVVRLESGAVRVRFGFHNEPTSLPEARRVLDALQYSDQLIKIYYESGHMIHGRSIFQRHVQPHAFHHWQWADFTGYEIAREKPIGSSPAEIHSKVGMAGDLSLFGWVVNAFSSGWLTCDDGPGEIADFVHIDNDGTLSLIHVKAAKSSARSRRIAVGPYEIVASQASKNLINLDPSRLRDRLESSPAPQPATWVEGIRVDSREDLLDALSCRSPRDQARVVIVQPHLSKVLYQRAGGLSPMEESFRLNLLETLLNSVRGSVTSQGAELVVIASER
ncbi:hypothetical protein [Nonomuraea sp. LPB2021202275-12-8]|uniref:hypothetical protein n=1 Tax=Nonomuraea sp. LPB2021202275-12-8 TaxID=3120159 RepID=UPI00300DB2D1